MFAAGEFSCCLLSLRLRVCICVYLSISAFVNVCVCLPVSVSVECEFPTDAEVGGGELGGRPPSLWQERVMGA